MQRMFMFLDFQTEFHDDAEIFDVHAPNDYFTKSVSASTVAKFLHPTFTNNIVGQGTIGAGTLNPTSSIQASGTFNFDIT